MPRQSVEGKAGAAWRARSQPVKVVHEPPEHLSDDARRLWAKILASRPADWFEEGSLPLLAQYCDLVAEQAKLVQQRNELVRLKPVDIMDRTAIVTARSRLGKSIIEHSAQCSSLALKLRLTVQNTIDRRSGVLDEKQPEAAVVAQRSSLLAGRRLGS